MVTNYHHPKNQQLLLDLLHHPLQEPVQREGKLLNNRHFYDCLQGSAPEGCQRSAQYRHLTGRKTLRQVYEGRPQVGYLEHNQSIQVLTYQ